MGTRNWSRGGAAEKTWRAPGKNGGKSDRSDKETAKKGKQKAGWLMNRILRTVDLVHGWLRRRGGRHSKKAVWHTEDEKESAKKQPDGVGKKGIQQEEQYQFRPADAEEEEWVNVCCTEWEREGSTKTGEPRDRGVREKTIYFLPGQQAGAQGEGEKRWNGTKTGGGLGAKGYGQFLGKSGLLGGQMKERGERS